LKIQPNANQLFFLPKSATPSAADGNRQGLKDGLDLASRGEADSLALHLASTEEGPDLAKVARICAQMKDGEYLPEPEAVADALLGELEWLGSWLKSET
jgi:hypothetical protein